MNEGLAIGPATDSVLRPPQTHAAQLSLLSWGGLLRAGLAMLAFALAAQFGFLFASGAALTPVWPPAAVALAVAYLYGWRMLWAVLLYIAYDYISVAPGLAHRYAYALIEPAGVLLGALLTPWLLRRLRFDPALQRGRDLLLLTAVCLLHPVCSALVSTFGYCAWAGTLRCAEQGWWQHGLEAWVGDVFGLWICLPALFSWALALDPVCRTASAAAARTELRSWRIGRPALGAIAATLLVLALMVWLSQRSVASDRFELFLAVPLLVWMALRLAPIHVHSAILVVGLAVMAIQLLEPQSAHSVMSLGARLVTYFLALFSSASLSLYVAVTTAAQLRFAAALQAHNASLEAQLQDRARDLDAALAQLLTALDERQRLVEQLEAQAHSDSLTRIANRRCFIAEAARRAVQRRAHAAPCALLLFDLDRFKQVNDRHGHETGDYALVRVASAVLGELREHDLVARLGGEEFAVLLPETTGEAALAMAERLREAVARVQVPLARGATLNLTASFGCIEWALDESIDQALSRAGAVLDAAKAAGRNRVQKG